MQEAGGQEMVGVMVVVVVVVMGVIVVVVVVVGGVIMLNEKRACMHAGVQGWLADMQLLCG